MKEPCRTRWTTWDVRGAGCPISGTFPFFLRVFALRSKLERQPLSSVDSRRRPRQTRSSAKRTVKALRSLLRFLYAEAIERVHDDDVALARALLRAWVCRSSRRTSYRRRARVARDPGLLERVDLTIEILLDGRDARVTKIHGLHRTGGRGRTRLIVLC